MIFDERPLGDPALDVIGRYLAHCAKEDVGPQWGTVASGEIVQRVAYNDPVERFSTRDLPALYVWRRDVRPAVVTVEGSQLKSEVMVLWVFEPASVDKQVARTPFLLPFAGCLNSAMRQNRRPGFVYPGDEAPGAATSGSNITKLCQANKITYISSDSDDISIEDGAGTQHFLTVLTQFEIVQSELSLQQTGLWPNVGHIDVTSGDGTINRGSVDIP